MPKRRTPDDVRNELELLRTRLEDGKLTQRQYAALSARFLDELNRLSKARRRLALT